MTTAPRRLLPSLIALILVALAAALSPPLARAQGSGKLVGSVVDKKTGRAIAFVNVAIPEAKIAAELRDFARGRHPGRTRDDQVTVFKSVGFALEDLAAAEAVYEAHPDA
jgi:hypothetical protein